MRQQHNKQAGVVSLFTVLFFTILVSVLTIGFLRIMLQQRRQSTDDDLSSRAYYAAESGIEEGKRALRDYFDNGLPPAALNGNTCDAPTGYSKTISTNPDTAYSCMFINLTPPNILATLPGNGNSLHWPLYPENHAHFDRVRISWHSLTDNAVDGQPVALRNAGDTTNPTVSNWETGGIQYPAMLRAQFYGNPRGVQFDRNALESRNRVTFLNPVSTGASTVHPIDNLDDGNPNTAAKSPQNIYCTNTDTALFGGYACQTTIDISSLLGPGPSDNVVYLRLKSLYDQGGTQVKIELFNGAQPLNQKTQALIDATGRAGDLFRRLQARVNISDFSLLPEYAIESGDSICKRFELSDTTEELNGCTVR